MFSSADEFSGLENSDTEDPVSIKLTKRRPKTHTLGSAKRMSIKGRQLNKALKEKKKKERDVSKSVFKTYAARRIHQAKPLSQSFKAELGSFMEYEDAAPRNYCYRGAATTSGGGSIGPSVYLTDQNRRVGSLQKMEVERQAENNIRKLLTYLYCDEMTKDIKVVCRGGRVVKAHCAILANVSTFVRDLLTVHAQTEPTDHVVMCLPNYEHHVVDYFVQKCYLLQETTRMPKADLLRDLCKDLRIDSICAVDLIDALKMRDREVDVKVEVPMPRGAKIGSRKRKFLGGSGHMLTLLASNDLNLFSTTGFKDKPRVCMDCLFCLLLFENNSFF